MTRFIFVTGGVASSLGKGIAAASLGALLQKHGFSVRLRKFEPYLNVDPGTMSPYQHGEVYVTDDGAETDLDLGHYERFTGVACRKTDAVTTGQIYQSVILKERRGDYLGATVQVIPHVTDAIKETITKDIDPDLDFLICEVGGTVGDIESLPFLEALRQFSNDIGQDKVLFMHLTLVPYIASAGELKTKPSQHSVKELQMLGIQPNILLCRCDRPLPDSARQKLALFCNIKLPCVIEAQDVKTIYQVPLTYSEAGLDQQVLKYFDLSSRVLPDMRDWRKFVSEFLYAEKEVRIGIIGKYVDLKDAYKSLNEAIFHAGVAQSVAVKIDWISAENLEVRDMNHRVAADDIKVRDALKKLHAIIIPGGYGERGIAGKMAAIRYAREHKIPFLGICLGMQLSVIEALQNVLGLKEANSTEFVKTAHPVVGLLSEWQQGASTIKRAKEDDLGGTMRLGLYECVLKTGTLAHRVYKMDRIKERHRHRYEVNIQYQPQIEQAGLLFSGLSEDGCLPEIVERLDHPWFVAVQFHPELISKPFHPHPLFTSFIGAAQEQALSHEKKRS